MAVYRSKPALNAAGRLTVISSVNIDSPIDGERSVRLQCWVSVHDHPLGHALTDGQSRRDLQFVPCVFWITWLSLFCLLSPDAKTVLLVTLHKLETLSLVPVSDD